MKKLILTGLLLLPTFSFAAQPSYNENFLQGVLSTTNVLPVVLDQQSDSLNFISVAAFATIDRTMNNKILVIGFPNISDTINKTVDTGLEKITAVKLDGADLKVTGEAYNYTNGVNQSATVWIAIKKQAGDSDYLTQVDLTARTEK